MFATTEEFLRRFGIGSTQNLPTPDPETAAEIRMEVEEELKGSGELLPEVGSVNAGSEESGPADTNTNTQQEDIQ